MHGEECVVVADDDDDGDVSVVASCDCGKRTRGDMVSTGE